MDITYVNYLKSKVVSKFTSHYTFTDQQKAYQSDHKFFEFTVIPDEAMIVAQAELFARWIHSTGLFDKAPIPRNVDQYTNHKLTIARCYVYSYIKSVLFSTGIRKRDIRFMSGRKSNLCFYGHKILHDSILEGTIYSSSPLGNSISLEISTDDISDSTFSNWIIWDLIYNEEYDEIYSSDLEIMLNYISTHCQNYVAIEHIGSHFDPCVRQLMTIPIGNSCLSPDLRQFQFIDCDSTATDHKSFYYGKANCIASLNVPSIDADDEIYDTILVSNYDTRGVAREVESITGFNPYGNIRSVGEYTTTGSSPDIPYEPDSGTSFNSGGDKKGAQRTNNNKQKGKSKKSNTQPKNQLQKVVEVYKKLSTDAVAFVRRVDEVLSNDKLDFVASIITDLTGKNVRPKELKKFIGSPLAKIWNNYHIVLNDEIRGKENEYGSIYLEGRRGNNDELYNVRLTGTPLSLNSN